jgi:SAM-dependent methyltransferase
MRSRQVFKQEAAAYLSPPRRKDSFAHAYRWMDRHGVGSVLDIGCASGDFLYYLPERVKGMGMDISAALIRQARERVRRPNVEFRQGDVLTAAARRGLKGKFDLITLLGVLHTFLDYRAMLRSVLSLEPRYLLIHSPFGESDVDAQHFHKTREMKRYECGYHILSRSTVGSFLRDELRVNTRFEPFNTRVTLKKDPSDPMRNYHVRVDGRRLLTNGMGILFQEYFLEVTRKKGRS